MNGEISLQFQQTLNILIETLIKPVTLKRDLFFALLLIVIKENDFVLKGNTEINVVDYILSKRRKTSTIYEIVVILNLFPDTPAKIIASPLSDMMLINAIIPNVNDETHSLCLLINEYIITSSLGIPSRFTNLDQLLVTFKEKVIIPLRSTILSHHNQPSCSLRGLPDDLLYQILICLPLKDILRLSESCTRLCQIVKEESLWSRLCRRDFTKDFFVKHENSTWRDLYKYTYVKKQNDRFGASSDVRSDVMEDVYERLENMTPVRDSTWEVIL